MTDIQIRKATFDDLPILYDFEQGIIQAERPFDETLKSGHINYYDLKAMIDDSETDVIVAVYKEEIIGSAYSNIREAKPYLKHAYYAYLGFMYVKPEYRGKGVNRMIVEELKKLALARGIHELRLDVYSDNHAAIRAYEKAGFEKQMVNMRIEI